MLIAEGVIGTDFCLLWPLTCDTAGLGEKVEFRLEAIWCWHGNKTSGICHLSVLVLFFSCLVAWAHVTACRLRQHEALSCFRRVREHRVLAVSFTEWRVKFLRAEQQVLGQRKHKWQEPSQGKTCHRWRLASRGRQALRLGSVATVKQVRKDEGPYETVVLHCLFFQWVTRHWDSVTRLTCGDCLDLALKFFTDCASNFITIIWHWLQPPSGAQQ